MRRLLLGSRILGFVLLLFALSLPYGTYTGLSPLSANESGIVFNGTRTILLLLGNPIACLSTCAIAALLFGAGVLLSRQKQRLSLDLRWDLVLLMCLLVVMGLWMYVLIPYRLGIEVDVGLGAIQYTGFTPWFWLAPWLAIVAGLVRLVAGVVARIRGRSRAQSL